NVHRHPPNRRLSSSDWRPWRQTTFSSWRAAVGEVIAGKRGLWLGLLVVTVIIQGCATPPPLMAPPEPPPARTSALLARDRDFAVVIAQTGDNLTTLAERYLSDA